MKTNLSMLFYMKKQKNYNAGPAPIYLRITVEGMRSEVATGRECDPKRWNKKSRRATGTKEDIRSFNAYLDNLQSRVYEAYRCLFEKNELITAESLKNKIMGKVEKPRMLIEIFKDHNIKIGALIGQEFAVGTLERYETSLRHTVAFVDYQDGVSDIDIKKIDHAFIREYDFYLRSIRKCANNSAVKYIQNFGKIIRISLSSGWILADPFANYKSKIKIVDRIFLSQDELQRMADKEFARFSSHPGYWLNLKALSVLTFKAFLILRRSWRGGNDSILFSKT